MFPTTFTAELHCQHGRVGVVETPIYVHPAFSIDQDGWLCTEDQRGDTPSFLPIRFLFKFVKKSGNRLHYQINGAETWKYFGSILRQNKKGWLGLYASHVMGRLLEWSPPSVIDKAFNDQAQWKIELLQEWDGSLESAGNIPFYLRDASGYRVALVKAIYDREKPVRHNWFLNAGEKDGEILVFHLKDIQFI